MNEMNMTREDLYVRHKDIDINHVGLDHFKCSMHDFAMADFVEFGCDKTGKRKCLKARYTWQRKVGSIY